MKFILLFSSMGLVIAGQLLLKKGVSTSNTIHNLDSIINTVFTPYVFIGLILYGISAIVWLLVLQKFPLSVAYPSLSLTYVVIVVLSFLFLKEPINSAKLVGIFLILGGIYFLYK